MEVLSWYVLFDLFVFLWSILAFRLQDTGSERDGMQPHDGWFSFLFLFLNYLLKTYFLFFSADLLDVMCKSFYFTIKFKVETL